MAVDRSAAARKAWVNRSRSGVMDKIRKPHGPGEVAAAAKGEKGSSKALQTIRNRIASSIRRMRRNPGGKEDIAQFRAEVGGPNSFKGRLKSLKARNQAARSAAVGY